MASKTKTTTKPTFEKLPAPAKLDPLQKAALAFVSRPRKDVTPKAELTAGHWAGLPEHHEGGQQPPRLIVSFPDQEARRTFVERFGIPIMRKAPNVWNTRWPDHQMHDVGSLRFVERES